MLTLAPQVGELHLQATQSQDLEEALHKVLRGSLGTDERPNVYCEVGYAKSRGIPFILTFHKKDPTIGPPWERQDIAGNRIHFDLAAFRYGSYDNPLHLRDQLKVELEALFEQGEAT